MSVHWHGSLATSGLKEDCYILDISQSGARVQCPEPFDGAAEVTLLLAQGDRHDSNIVWRQGSFMGLAFATAAAA